MSPQGSRLQTLEGSAVHTINPAFGVGDMDKVSTSSALCWRRPRRRRGQLVQGEADPISPFPPCAASLGWGEKEELVGLNLASAGSCTQTLWR